jgi:hypothetical protein
LALCRQHDPKFEIKQLFAPSEDFNVDDYYILRSFGDESFSAFRVALAKTLDPSNLNIAMMLVFVIAHIFQKNGYIKKSVIDGLPDDIRNQVESYLMMNNVKAYSHLIDFGVSLPMVPQVMKVERLLLLFSGMSYTV